MVKNCQRQFGARSAAEIGGTFGILLACSSRGYKEKYKVRQTATKALL